MVQKWYINPTRETTGWCIVCSFLRAHRSNWHCPAGNGAEFLWISPAAILFCRKNQDCLRYNWQVQYSAGKASANQLLRSAAQQVAPCIALLQKGWLLAINLQTNKSSSRYCSDELCVNLRWSRLYCSTVLQQGNGGLPWTINSGGSKINSDRYLCCHMQCRSSDCDATKLPGEQ